MSVPTNILQQVRTYQKAGIALLLNEYALINLSNKKFDNFQNRIANLGDTVTFELAPRSSTVKSLVATFEAQEQRIQSLTVDKPVSSSMAFTAEQILFYDVETYTEKFGKAAIAEIGADIESDVGQTILDSTYRFYGDGATAIDSFTQLATAVKYFNNYGSVKTDLEAVIPDLSVPGIIGNGLDQFAIKRNDEIAEKWELGPFAGCKWYESNYLPIHTAGAIGNGSTSAKQTLTVVSTNDPTGANITQITCSCDASLANTPYAVRLNDLGQFTDTTFKYLTWIGHKESGNPVQIRVTADAASSGTTVVLNISPALCMIQGRNQNINKNVTAGMTIKMVPSHRAGLIMSGKPLYLAMPRLPDQKPFDTANETDPETGATVRMTYGSTFGQNQYGIVYDNIHGSCGIPEQMMRVCFPL